MFGPVTVKYLTPEEAELLRHLTAPRDDWEFSLEEDWSFTPEDFQSNGWWAWERYEHQEGVKQIELREWLEEVRPWVKTGGSWLADFCEGLEIRGVELECLLSE